MISTNFIRPSFYNQKPNISFAASEEAKQEVPDLYSTSGNQAIMQGSQRIKETTRIGAAISILDDTNNINQIAMHLPSGITKAVIAKALGTARELSNTYGKDALLNECKNKDEYSANHIASILFHISKTQDKERNKKGK